jgi:hypothetical protein
MVQPMSVGITLAGGAAASHRAVNHWESKGGFAFRRLYGLIAKLA